MPPIVTLTLNPTVDVTWEVDRLVAEGKSRARHRTAIAGGGGINVARGVAALGGEVRAVHTSGKDVGRRLNRLLDEEGLDHVCIDIEEETREAFILLPTDPPETYHVVPSGPGLSRGEGSRILDLLLDEAADASYVVVSGSLPDGLMPDFSAEVVRRINAAGPRVVLDTSGQALSRALDEGVFLAKPNKREAAELIGRPLEGFDDAQEVNGRLLGAGAAEIVVTTVGELGALCSTEAGHVEVRPPALPRDPLSDAGAGDSLVAGLVSLLSQGAAPVEACSVGVAAAAASMLTPGTEVFRRTDLDELLPRVRTRRRA